MAVTEKKDMILCQNLDAKFETWTGDLAHYF